MSKFIGFDLDGTLMPYGRPDSTEFNTRIVLPHKGDDVVILTNQGGLSFKGPKYPKAWQVALRIYQAVALMTHVGAHPALVRVALFHPDATLKALTSAHNRLDTALRNTHYWWPSFCHIEISTSPDWRMPSDGMFQGTGGGRLDHFYGNSDESEQAAKEASVPFTRVVRWM